MLFDTTPGWFYSFSTTLDNNIYIRSFERALAKFEAVHKGVSGGSDFLQNSRALFLQLQNLCEIAMELDEIADP